MIVTETIGTFTQHFSDSGFKIRQIETGAVYDDAMDITPCPYTYEETDTPIAHDTEIIAESIDKFAPFILRQNLVQFPEQEEPDYLNEAEPEPNYFDEPIQEC